MYHAAETAFHYSGADIALNRAIIVRALFDALGLVGDEVGQGEARMAKASARAWFKFAPERFREVCDCAGLNWKAVQESALRQMKDYDEKGIRPARTKMAQRRATIPKEID